MGKGCGLIFLCFDRFFVILMNMFRYCGFVLLAYLAGVSIADFTYQLDFNNPSFILYGVEIYNRTIYQIKPPTESDWIQVNGLFKNLQKTNFLVQVNGMAFGPEDISNGGARGLRLQGTIQLFVAQGNDQNFYLSFSLYKDSIANNGFNGYLLAEYSDPLRQNQFSFQSNSTTSAALTIVNLDYMNAMYFEWDLQNVSLSNGCAMDIFVGGHPVESGSIYLIYSLSSEKTKTFVSSTFSAAYYTFILPPNCQASLGLFKTNYNNPPLSTDASHGFVASWEYPGGTFSRSSLANSFTKRIQASDSSGNQVFYPIFVDLVGLNAGDQGYLSLGFYHLNNLINAQNLTSVAQNTWYNQTGVDELRLTWAPGQAGRKGFLLRYRFGSDDPDIYSITEYSFVFDSKRKTKKSNRIECPGCKIQVNAMTQMNPGMVEFSDATTTVTLSFINNQSAFFKDYVQFNNVDQVGFLATFTAYNDATRAKMGLDDYTIRNIDSKNGGGLMINAKPTYQAVTIYNYMVPFNMWIGNVTMAPSCEIPLYVGGIPPEDPTKAKSLEIYRFRSVEVPSFSRSGITPAAATFIIPPQCSFKADFAQYMDGLADPLVLGSKGFMMSGEYPGVQGSDSIDPLQAYSKFAINQNSLNIGNFHITIPMADPGDGGQLRVHNENISRTVLSKEMYFQDFNFEVFWSPSQKPRRGFLLQYELIDVLPTGWPTYAPTSTGITETTTKSAFSRTLLIFLISQLFVLLR